MQKRDVAGQALRNRPYQGSSSMPEYIAWLATADPADIET